MAINTIAANLSCRNLDASISWYKRLFGKDPTRLPMAGLAEWSIIDSAEVQLFEAAEHAGHGTLTIGVSGLEQEHARLVAAGLTPGEIEKADRLFIVRMRDPDGNLVVLASPERS